MASIGDDISQMALAIGLVRSRQMIMVAGLALFVYDPLLTLEQEYKYIWRSRWTASKAIYLYLRYGAPAFQTVIYGKFLFGVGVTADHCHRVNAFDVMTWILAQELALLIMALRTSAIYRNQKPINLLIAVAYLLNLASHLAVCWKVILQVEWTEANDGLELGCAGICRGTCLTYQRASWIPTVSFEGLLFAMTVFKALRHEDIFSTRLLTALYRDGLMYFTAIFGLGVTQLLFINLLPVSDNWMAIGSAFAQGIFRALVSIACCRLILNLRGVLTEPGDFDTAIHQTSETRIATTMHFASLEGTSTSTTEHPTLQEVPSFPENPHDRPVSNGSAEHSAEGYELVRLSRGCLDREEVP